ncbi:glycoprotein hormone beta-5-like [Acanthaster planci]|uniref:Glycoprotein hormone beta-5-like n=1 Tax=Acanthaster planci TaxID=133434 RepID=A0A8B7Y369_ACAPL|nr:glycoprotein hormone beta-5-like [Acanthaster planci]
MTTVRLTAGQYLVVLGFLLVVVMNARPCESQDSLSCTPRQYLKYYAQKPGCRPQRVTIYGCYGRCHTSEVPRLLPPYKISDHDMCSYGETEQREIQLDDCDPGVDPTFGYIDAVSCVCEKCRSAFTYCQGI